jgi:uncharacterized protein YyaL (SSP411 family)
LRGAPKFPQPAILEMLWRAGLRTKDARFFETVEHTLARMCEGGIYDHLGGGFSRYSVDERWLVPHFEKMLYDNAQLLELLSLAWQHSKNPLFAQRARETVAWLNREMTSGEGAFYASLDADSEGEEGKFYVWSYDEVTKTLGETDGKYFTQHYDVEPGGNFEGLSILNRLAGLDRTAEDEIRLTQLRAKLLAARERRIRPGLDDKVLADWNGLMIAALVNSALIIDEPDWLTPVQHCHSMKRPANAVISRRPSRGRILSINTTSTLKPAPIIFPLTMRTISCCGRIRPRTTPRRIQIPWPRKTSSGLRSYPATKNGGRRRIA